MKKLFHYLLVAAASLTLASCVQDIAPVSDPALGGEPVPVSFSVNLGDALTKAAPEASDFDNASGEFKLYVAVFSKTNGALISSSKIGGTGYEPVETVTAKNVSIVLTLSRKQDYKVVFFAMHEGAYDLAFADNNVATFTFKRSVKANDASLDAFYAAVDVTADTKKYDVTMKRPFAQLNVLAPKDNVPAGQTAFASTMTVTAPASFNLFSGAAGTDVQDITFENNAIAATPVGSYKETHAWIGMNFVLVPATGKVTVTAFAESGMTEPVRVGEVPVKVNSRTNIVGSIYSLSDYFFNVTTDSGFADESEATLDVDEGGEGGETPTDTEVVIAGGNTYTETAPFAIDASNPNAPKKVTLTVNGGDSVATIEAGAGGAKVTAASSAPEVATVAVSGNDVVVTPVGNGKAKITVSIPAYTKASYNAQTFDFWVEITGISSGGEGGEGGEEGGSDTIVFADLSLTNGTQYKDPFTQGNMQVQFGSGSNDGKYYDTGTGMRIYGDGWVTVSSSKTITKIEYTFDPTEQKDGDVTKTFLPDEATFGSVDVGSYDKATQTWTGSAKSVKLTRATGTGHWRLQKIVAYYGEDSGETPVQPVTATLTVSPASLNLTVGESATLTATTNSSATPTFSTSDAGVASVDADGKVTAKAAGTATITVSVAAVEGAFTAASKTVPVTVTAAGGGESTAKDLPYVQNFKAAGQGDFVIDNKTLPEGLSYVWSYDNRYGMKASGYYQQAYDTESWLVSPVVNLSSAQHPVLTFRHAVNQFVSIDKAKEEATVWVREENGTWTKLTGVTYPSSLSWDFVDSGEIDLSGYKGKKIQVAFKYVSTTTKAGTWEVDKFSIADQAGSGGGQGGGGEAGNPDATLTNAEIQAATKDAEITSSNPSYRNAEISSASGTWTANMAKHKDGLKFLQLRNKKGAFITSPLFSSAISKVEVTITSEDVDLLDRTLHAVPASTSVPTGDDAYTNTVWANEYGCVRTGAEKGATVTIDFPEDSDIKQFMLIVEGGATYIDHIDVYY